MFQQLAFATAQVQDIASACFVEQARDVLVPLLAQRRLKDTCTGV